MAASAAGRNSTFDAIAKMLPAPAGWTVDDAVPFSSARKWSATRIAGRGSWVLGAPEIVATEDPADVPAAHARAQAATLADEGLRVLLLSHTEAPLRGEVLPEGLEPAGLVILSERVRSDAPQTLAYFREQGVQIKVISGDNPATVATIAAKAGVPGAEKAVDARSLPEGEELAEIMETTTVFGRVNPDQKAAMVEALQSRGHVVAMTGDGVNDVLALKKADMGIAMGTGTAAARAVSQLVLVDSRFSTLPGVVAEGRRVTANIERVANLFTTKSVWAALLAISVAALAIDYPILPRHLTIIDGLVIGIPGFFLALAPNPRRFIPGFVFRVARFVLPTGLLAADHSAAFLCSAAKDGGVGRRGPDHGDDDLLRRRLASDRGHRATVAWLAPGPGGRHGGSARAGVRHTLHARLLRPRPAGRSYRRRDRRILRVRLALRRARLAHRQAPAVLARSGGPESASPLATPLSRNSLGDGQQMVSSRRHRIDPVIVSSR